jgi:hypothetical protein
MSGLVVGKKPGVRFTKLLRQIRELIVTLVRNNLRFFKVLKVFFKADIIKGWWPFFSLVRKS